MKTLITTMLFIYSISIVAQQPLDTIYANSKKNVAMFFPNPIRQAITGTSNFVFTYNREKEQYFGLLQAQQGEESNLLTVTNDGNVYSYVLKYADKLPKLNYFINEANSIGNEKPKVLNALKEKKAVNHNGDKIEYFERACVYLLKLKYENLATKRENSIRLQLQKMVYDGDEVYLVIEIKNTSGINFELDYLNIYSVNGNSKKKASYQSIKQEVIYKYVMPSKIQNGQSQRLVYVLPKFVLGDNEKLMIELKELKGSRRVVLKK